jgi:hypothetical protein
MTGGDLIVAAPWLVFGAGLTAIGWRLAAGRGDRARPPPPGAGTRPKRDRPVHPRTGPSGSDRGELAASI